MRIAVAAVSAKTLVPPAHVDGIDEGSLMYVCQSGTGAAGPVQTRREVLPGRPVDPIASERRSERRKFRNSPMPPRICGPPRMIVASGETLTFVPGPRVL